MPEKLKYGSLLALVFAAFCIVGTMDYEHEQRDAEYAQAYYDEVRQRYDFAHADGFDSSQTRFP